MFENPRDTAAPRRRRLWWRFLTVIVQPKMAKALARVALDGYLTETGWMRTVASGEVVDANGSPVPWATYPFVDFFRPRLRREFAVFEYGAGASTRFYAAHCRRVAAVDHDAEFVRTLRERLPENAAVTVHPDGSEAYVGAILAMEEQPHVVSIDGRERVRCVPFVLQCVAPGGVIVFDDTERSEYEPGLREIGDAGFRRLDFWGVSAGAEMRRCTTLFYRTGNVLGI